MGRMVGRLLGRRHKEKYKEGYQKEGRAKDWDAVSFMGRERCCSHDKGMLEDDSKRNVCVLSRGLPAKGYQQSTGVHFEAVIFFFNQFYTTGV